MGIVQKLKELVEKAEAEAKVVPAPPALIVSNEEQFDSLLSPMVTIAIAQNGDIKATVGEYHDENGEYKQTNAIFLSCVYRDEEEKKLAAELIASDLERLAIRGDLRGRLAGFNSLKLYSLMGDADRSVLFYFPHVKGGAEFASQRFSDRAGINLVTEVREGECGRCARDLP